MMIKNLHDSNATPKKIIPAITLTTAIVSTEIYFSKTKAQSYFLAFPPPISPMLNH